LSSGGVQLSVEVAIVEFLVQNQENLIYWRRMMVQLRFNKHKKAQNKTIVNEACDRFSWWPRRVLVINVGQLVPTVFVDGVNFMDVRILYE